MAVTLNALTTGVGGLQTTGDTSGAIQLQSNGTATLTVDSSGNVGIGTASPGSKLEVAGLATFQKGGSSGITIGDVSTNSGSVIRMQGTNATYNWQIDNNVVLNGLSFSPSTTVGGTTYTTAALTLTGAGAIGLSGANYGTSGQVLTSGGSGAAVSWTTISTTPTTAQVLTATSGYTAGVVGSFANGYSGSGAQANNATVAGSTLTNPANANIGFSGTWRCLAFASAGGYITNWVRSA
jgi:hypothetical protein